MSDDLDNIDWTKTTFEGAERENLRSWQRLSFDEKLRASESMNEMFEEIIRRKKASGEPYIDPETGELVPGNPASQVAESPGTYPNSNTTKPSGSSSTLPPS